MVKIPSDPKRLLQPKPSKQGALDAIQPPAAKSAAEAEAGAASKAAKVDGFDRVTGGSMALADAARAVIANAARNLGDLPSVAGPVEPGQVQPDLGLGAKGSALAELEQRLGGDAAQGAHPDAARFPKLPNNRDAGGSAGSSADALRPSMDPRDWISGSRGKDYTGDKTVEDLGGGDTRTTYDHGDGTSTIVTDTHDPRGVPLGDGRVVLGMALRSVEQRNPDGSGIITNYVRDLNGQWIETGRGFRGPGEGINRTLDPNADGGSTILPPNVRIKDPGLRDPNRYRPPGETDPGRAPQLEIDTPGLAGDPSLREQEVDLERLKRLQGWKLPVHVLPPRPGGGGDE